MKKAILLFLFFQCFIYTSLLAQMWSETQNDTLYGNEWINFEQADRYYKIKVAEDGLYRINASVLTNADIPISNINTKQYKLFCMGEEVPIYTNVTNQALSNGDYIDFYGKKNRSELDRHLFKNPDLEMLNPQFSLVTDTMTYFLTWTEEEEGQRYETIENNLSGNLPEKEPWFIEEQLTNYTNVFFKKYEKISSTDVYYSNFDVAEGFATGRSSNRTEQIEAIHLHPNATNAHLSIRLGTNVGAHHLQIKVEDDTYIDTSFQQVQLQQFDLEVPISESDPDLEINIRGLEGNADQHVLSNIILTYQRQFNFDNQDAYLFNLAASIADKYLEIENFNTEGQAPILYDISNQLRLETLVENGQVKVLLPPSMTDRQIILLNPTTAIQTIDALEQTVFVDYTANDYQDTDYILLSHKAFFDDGQGHNLVQEYANYRASVQGGAYETAVIDIEQLYDQFGYGIYAHAISVRNFAHYIKKNWEVARYFFIIGKGREYRDLRTTSQFEQAHNKTFFVPTFGWPGADNLMLSDNYSNVPILATGRVSCRNTAELNIYFDKVKAFEAAANVSQTLENKAWMKNILHLGGGSNASEQSSIKNSLLDMENVISNNKFGAKVSSFYKKSSDPVQTSVSQQIFDRINKGVSIITFFGHSSAGTFDFNIDNPDNYDNFGKTPLLFALGCNAGNYFTEGHSITERFTFYKDKGTIAFGASRGFGFVSSLRQFMKKYYELAGGEMYGQGMGDILRETTAQRSHSSFIGDATLVQQFTFQADPALRLYPSPGPDYVIDKTSVRFEPNVVSLSQDSFKLNFEVVNIGQHVLDSMSIQIVQELPNGERFVIKKDTLFTPAYANQLTYTLATLEKSSVGLNKFFITVDKDDDVEELPAPVAELNNELKNLTGELGTTLFIVDNSATPVYPTNFGIVGSQELVLKASTADALAPKQKYILELDTTALFNSPMKKRTEIEQNGGLIKWQPNINYENETVYYWRISPDSTDADIGYLWANSSFTYVEGSAGGWSQGHYFQFLENEDGNIKLNEDSRKFEFTSNATSFRVRNGIYQTNEPPNGYMNNLRWSDFFRWDIHESLTVVVFDELGRVWFNRHPGEYGSVNERNTPIASFPFPLETIDERSNFINFIENIIPDNHTVFVYTAQRTANHDLNIEEWESDSLELEGKNIFNTLENQGATQLRALSNNVVPYIYSFNKNGDKIGEVMANNMNDIINFEHSIPGFWYEGEIKSNLIGPAKSWMGLKLEYEDILPDALDSIVVNVYGVSKNKQVKDLLIENLSTKDTTINFIDPISYPYLQLEYYAIDEENLSVSQLNLWQVTYEGLPDAALNTREEFVFHNDTLQQGEMLEVNILLEATNQVSMDSLLIKYWIVNAQGQEILNYKRLAPLHSSHEILANIQLETKDLTGLYQFWLEVNPNNDQEELFNFNNYLVKNFYIEKDSKNPLLDVTFDGMHIFNGDIIQPTPLIQISLQDENQFLLLQDTSLFSIKLTQPDGQLKNIIMNSPSVQFTPANSTANNKATIEFNPIFEQSGTYQLNVQAKDVANNLAGDLDYNVDFQVILEKMVSNVLNYPNPFSTSTRFVYTLTGDSPPDDMTIQILTVGGQIVREIRQEELGELKIGRHQTDFAWDGTDEFGDRLANGVYLYRVIVKDENGDDYDTFDTGTNQFFKNGFGKLVILR